MARYAVLGLALTLMMCGCASGAEVVVELSEEDSIREAVFRTQFEDNVSGQRENANAYFLSVEGGSDPSDELLRKFEGHTPAVKPVSASTLEAGTALVLDRESGLPGLIFDVGEIRWIKGDEVEVEGGYEEASESASGGVFRLRKVKDRWEVVASQMLWIK
jgi:hypothetical protein